MAVLVRAKLFWADRLRRLLCRRHRPAAVLAVYVLEPWRLCTVRLGRQEAFAAGRRVCRKLACEHCGRVWLSTRRELSTEVWRVET